MNRVTKLFERMGLSKTEAIIIHKPSNIFYLSGYTGEGLLVLGHGLSAIVTDFRYVEQGGREAPDFQVCQISKGKDHIHCAAELLMEKGVQTVRYEDDFVTVLAFEAMREAMPKMAFVSLKEAPEEMRRIKEEKELVCLRRACEISCDALDYLLGVIEPGMTENQIRLALDFKMLELGGEGLAFSTIAASGPNGSLPHAVPGERKVQKGELLTLDFGAKYQGYCADMTRTVSFGTPSDKMREIYEIVQYAQQTCEDALAPGKVCKDIDAMARKIIADAGYGKYFGHGLGHGVGIDVHEMPRLNPQCEEILQPGHVVTVEPGIYVPGLGGVRIEDTCEITETGFKTMVPASRELIIL